MSSITTLQKIRRRAIGMFSFFSLAAASVLVPNLSLGNTETTPMKLETATFAGGCFWCTEAVYQSIDGVQSVVAGYMGGHTKNPTYKEVCMGDTGHAEVIQIQFDPTRVSYAELADVFWQAHDPTTLNRQGADIGTQYRSAIFYHSDAQKEAAEASRTKAQQHFEDAIVTEITAASEFYEAEDYHQDFYSNNKTYPYCRVVITPKLKKLGIE